MSLFRRLLSLSLAAALLWAFAGHVFAHPAGDGACSACAVGDARQAAADAPALERAPERAEAAPCACAPSEPGRPADSGRARAPPSR